MRGTGTKGAIGGGGVVLGSCTAGWRQMHGAHGAHGAQKDIGCPNGSDKGGGGGKVGANGEGGERV